MSRSCVWTVAPGQTRSTMLTTWVGWVGLGWLGCLPAACGDDGPAGNESDSGGETTTSQTTDTNENTLVTSGLDDTTTENGPPEAVADVVFACQDSAVMVSARDGLLQNDSDSDGDSLVVTDNDVVSVAGATVTLDPDGAFTYVAVAGFWGADEFEYTVQDEQGLSASATVTVYVTPVQISLADVAAGVGGFAINGESAGDAAGRSVSGAGDVNGDGLADLIVGAPLASTNGTQTGRSYVVFGTTSTDAIELSAVAAGQGGFLLDGGPGADNSGWAVDTAGDVNGDGLDDLIVGAPYADGTVVDSGRSYVVFGKVDTATVELSAVAQGAGGFLLNGETGFGAGLGVSGAGDVNGDGRDDLLVGGPFVTNPGRTYVVFGKADTDAVELGAVGIGIGGFGINGGMDNDVAGRHLSGAGDVNGDGLDDIVVGDPFADPNGGDSGSSYVVFGKADTSLVDLSGVEQGRGGFVMHGEAPNDQAGGAVGGAGDINGDGLADIIVGAPLADPNGEVSGRTYVVLGKVDTNAVQLGAVAAGQGGFVIDGVAPGEASGDAVANAGDVNGDGRDDLIVGAPFAGPEGGYYGSSYVVFGKTDTDAVALSLLSSTKAGFTLYGEEIMTSFSGGAVDGAGDVNGDGVADLIVGAAGADPNGVESGRSYVVFGVPGVGSQ